MEARRAVEPRWPSRALHPHGVVVRPRGSGAPGDPRRALVPGGAGGARGADGDDDGLVDGRVVPRASEHSGLEPRGGVPAASEHRGAVGRHVVAEPKDDPTRPGEGVTVADNLSEQVRRGVSTVASGS